MKLRPPSSLPALLHPANGSPEISPEISAPHRGSSHRESDGIPCNPPSAPHTAREVRPVWRHDARRVHRWLPRALHSAGQELDQCQARGSKNKSMKEWGKDFKVQIKSKQTRVISARRGMQTQTSTVQVGSRNQRWGWQQEWEFPATVAS